MIMSTHRLLLVEDSEFMTERVSTTLEQHHQFSVTSVPTVAEARARIDEDDSLECVIANYDLPDGTGIDLVDWLRNDSEHPGLPFILLSGNSLEELATQGLEAGVSAFVSKTNDVSSSMDIFANRIRLAIAASH